MERGDNGTLKKGENSNCCFFLKGGSAPHAPYQKYTLHLPQIKQLQIWGKPQRCKKPQRLGETAIAFLFGVICNNSLQRTQP